MNSSMENNELKRTATLVAPKGTGQQSEKVAVNDFVNEGNPTVVKPEADKKSTDKIEKTLSKKD